MNISTKLNTSKIILIGLTTVFTLNSCMVSKKNHLNEVAKINQQLKKAQTENEALKTESKILVENNKSLKINLAQKTTEIAQKEALIIVSENKLTEFKNAKSGEYSKFSGLNTTNDSMSYFIGNDMVKNLNQSGLEIIISELAFIQGIRDASIKDKKLLIEPKVGQAIAGRLMQKAQAKKAKLQQGEFAEKIAKGKAFLAKKSTEKDVVTLASGMRYKILTKGAGEKPKATDKVQAHYHGTLLDGTVFDSSVERGKPFVSKVNQVIKGWVEALQLMPVGSKWELYIPYHLAYGERGAGGAIGPYETLIFQVELLEIIQE